MILIFILLTYDIENVTKSGKSRLRKVAKTCENYGIRVQNSVFEITTDNGNFIKLKAELELIISTNDSIRFYNLGNNFENKVEVIGKKEKIEISSTNALII